MSKIQGETLRERMARLETIMCNHLQHHEKHEKWLIRIGAVIIGGICLQVIPEVVRWLAKVL